MVEVRRSARRRRTISAYREGDRTIVLVPARLSRAEEEQWVETMLERLRTQEARKRRRSDDDLVTRAAAPLRRATSTARPSPQRSAGSPTRQSRWGSVHAG